MLQIEQRRYHADLFSLYQLRSNSAYAAYTTPRSWSLEMPVPSGSKQSYKGFSVSSPSGTAEKLAIENTIKHSKAASSTKPPPPPPPPPTTTTTAAKTTDEQHSLVAALPQTVAHLHSICLSGLKIFESSNSNDQETNKKVLYNNQFATSYIDRCLEKVKGTLWNPIWYGRFGAHRLHSSLHNISNSMLSICQVIHLKPAIRP